MTKRIIAITAIALVFFACNNTKQENEQQTQSEVLKVTQVLSNPDQFLNKDITVEGMVTHVCKHGGKRLHLSQSGTEEKLRVRAGEAMGAFERELEGSDVILTGRFIEERLDQDYVDRLKSGESVEESHEHHEEHDHAEGEHHHEDSDDKEKAQGVSEEFIAEMQAKIDSSENGYISEYWLESVKIEKK